MHVVIFAVVARPLQFFQIHSLDIQVKFIQTAEYFTFNSTRKMFYFSSSLNQIYRNSYTIPFYIIFDPMYYSEHNM